MLHTLAELVHELIDHEVPAGNRRGEMHEKLKRAQAEAAGTIADTPAGEDGEDGEDGEAGEAPAVPKTVFTPPKTSKPDGAAAA
jgi:hypothetical protein